MTGEGWSGLFVTAFSRSANPMVLVASDRRIVEVNPAFARLLGRARDSLVGRPLFGFVAGGPLATPDEWRDALSQGQFTGEARLVHASGDEVAVQWAAAAEVATGRRLVLFVALNTARWGSQFRRRSDDWSGRSELTRREREVVEHVAHGHTSPEIADRMGISHETVRTHVRNAMGKSGARSRAHLVAKALAEGLVHDEAVLPS
jgi:PAS domain S-box-containing protein